jgi:hypothetical protein
LQFDDERPGVVKKKRPVARHKFPVGVDETFLHVDGAGAVASAAVAAVPGDVFSYFPREKVHVVSAPCPTTCRGTVATSSVASASTDVMGCFIVRVQCCVLY